VGLAERVRARIYPKVADLEITAWRTAEPVPFEQRTSGQELHLKLGDCWGENLFDCAWFRFVAALPKDAPKPLVARIDINGELCIVDAQGEPVRGLTCAKSTFDPALGAATKTIYALPEERANNGRVELWADAGFNDLFGAIMGEGKIELSEVCFCREDIRALHYDLQVLADLFAGLPENDPLRDQVLYATGAAGAALATFDPEEVAQARALLQPLFTKAAHRPQLSISGIGHAHMDLAWLWPIRETFRKGARTFATALYNIARYPEYIYGCSQPQLFAWMKERYPALYGRIKNAVGAGRIEPLGQFWVEPDCNIPCGESLVRQVLHGAKFFREEFGIVPRCCWLPDVFGYNAQLPQILKKSGHDYFVTQKLSWNLVNRFPYQSFQWLGIDGSMVLAHMLPEETYNGPATPKSARKILDEYAQKDVSNRALMAFGIGDGGGGPDAEHLERLLRLKHLADLPEVVQQPVAEFLEEWARDAAQFPTWQGELYLERHQGTFTTQALNKRNNRRCELGLREAEWAAMLAALLAGVTFPADAIDALWKEVLLYQFHDILPGSSIKRVYDESNAGYTRILEALEAIIAASYQAVAGRVGGTVRPLVFNSLPWRRQEWMQHEGAWIFVDAAPMGYAELGQPGDIPSVFASERALENAYLRVEFAADGTISSLFDKQAGREMIAPGEFANRFVVFSDTGDAWDFQANHETKDIWIYLRQEPSPLTLETSRAFVDGPRAVLELTYRFKNSRLTQRIFLTSGSRALEFDTVVDWQEPQTMLRVRFPVAVDSPEARFEIPFGSITRSTREDSLVEKAQIEVPAQQWVDLSQEDAGVALLNDCKYGFRVKGHTLDMDLIRSVPHPGRALIGKEDAAGTGGVYTDLRRHEFRYALLPHAGRIGEAELTQAARALNIPLRVVAHDATGHGSLPEAPASFLVCENPALDIVATKPAEDGAGWIVRLVNVTPAAQETRLRVALPLGIPTETNLAENEQGRACATDPDGAVLLRMSPFEIKTLYFKTRVV